MAPGSKVDVTYSGAAGDQAIPSSGPLQILRRSLGRSRRDYRAVLHVPVRSRRCVSCADRRSRGFSRRVGRVGRVGRDGRSGPSAPSCASGRLVPHVLTFAPSPSPCRCSAPSGSPEAHENTIPGSAVSARRATAFCVATPRSGSVGGLSRRSQLSIPVHQLLWRFVAASPRIGDLRARILDNKHPEGQGAWCRLDLLTGPWRFPYINRPRQVAIEQRIA